MLNRRRWKKRTTSPKIASGPPKKRRGCRRLGGKWRNSPLVMERPHNFSSPLQTTTSATPRTARSPPTLTRRYLAVGRLLDPDVIDIDDDRRRRGERAAARVRRRGGAVRLRIGADADVGAGSSVEV